MPLKFLFDENLLHDGLWHAISKPRESHQALDVVRIGDADGPPRATPDEEIISWSSLHGRIVVSLDVSTMADELDAWVAKGFSHPGVILLRPGLSISAIIDLLDFVNETSKGHEWKDAFHWLP